MVGRLRDQAVLLHLAPERDGADLQGGGRVTSITAKPLERTLDRGPLQRLQVEAVAQSTLSRDLSDLGREFTDPDAAAAGDDHRALDGMLQLANVSGPVVFHQ